MASFNWILLYIKVFDEPWFKELVEWYYEGENDDTPIPLLPCFGGIRQQEVRDIIKDTSGKISVPKSKFDPKWWAMPLMCHVTNGVFLYTILKKLGKDVKIYEILNGENFHIFIKEKNDIYDLYNTMEFDYSKGKEISEENLKKKYGVKSLTI
jgi:hypothetical protein